jgi:hypothetical protein
MAKDNAIQYLKYLHTLEQEYRGNLVTQEIASLLEKVRLEFIVMYGTQ